MAVKGKEREKNPSGNLFIKSMVLCLAAILLILIGYFTAGYFSGGLV